MENFAEEITLVVEPVPTSLALWKRQKNGDRSTESTQSYFKENKVFCACSRKTSPLKTQSRLLTIL